MENVGQSVDLATKLQEAMLSEFPPSSGGSRNFLRGGPMPDFSNYSLNRDHKGHFSLPDETHDRGGGANKTFFRPVVNPPSTTRTNSYHLIPFQEVLLFMWLNRNMGTTIFFVFLLTYFLLKT